MEAFLGLMMLATFVVAVMALSRSHRLDSDLGAVRRRVAELETALARLREAPPPAAAPEPIPEPVAEPIPEPVVEAVASPPPPPPPPPAAAPKLGGERALTERWLVWLGGVALALGGIFLVKMSIELGLLRPEVRVALGGLTGIGLMALGHVLRRRTAGTLPWQVPPALVGAGAASLFAALFAAHALYGLIGALPTFAALAVVSAVTALMALAHGPFVALLGLAGAFVVPLLVHSNQPNALGLFTYLLLVSAGLLALLRWREWWWLAWAVLAAAGAWTLLWLGLSWHTGDEAVLGLTLLALFGLFAVFRLGVPWVAALALPAEAPMVRRVVAVAALVIAALLGLVVLAANHSGVALALPLAFAVGCIAFGWRDVVFDRLPWLAAVLLAGVVAVWHRPEPDSLAWVAGPGALLFAAAGFALLWRAPFAWRWAALAAGAPPLLLAASYSANLSALPAWGWTGVALALAALLVAGAERVARQRAHNGMEAALAALAVGVIAALALAATFALSEAWLTVALALMLPGIAWVEWHLAIAGLRRVALLLAGAVLVRLVLNPDILDYPLGDGGVVNWLLYGYGVPALAFWAAARRFRRTADDVVVAVLHGGAILFAVLLASLEIHQMMAGGLRSAETPSLAEFSLHTIAWLSGAALLYVAHGRGGGKVPLVAGHALMILATALAVLVQALFGNPIAARVAVGEGAILNLLLLAYGAPAVLYAVHARVAPLDPPWGRRVCGALALAFAFLWLTLEIRHGFAGPRLDVGGIGQAEMWAYSLAWLLGGVAMMGGGILRRSALLRRAGLGVVLLVVAKVFILDLGTLAGLWRALSFLALGVVLVGIGGLYRRFARYI